MKHLNTLISLLLIGLLSGCLTAVPGIGGRTHYRMEFVDTIDAVEGSMGEVIEPGQQTVFNVKIKAPAGVDVKDLTAMSYNWEPERGEISISQEASVNTDVQAEMLTEVSKMQAEIMAVTIRSIIGSLVPVLEALQKPEEVSITP